MVRWLLVFIGFLPIISEATNGRSLWDQVRFKNLKAGKTYEISSGTGFFVNNDYIITNHHVVDKCLNIAIRGAVDPTAAQLVAYDSEMDIALLQTKAHPKSVAKIRANYTLSAGDILFIIGYPLNHGQTGEYLRTEANIINIVTPETSKYSTIEFTNSVDHGNSGGPLIDKNSNVIGVVKAKKTYYNIHNPSEVYNITGIAIGVDGLTQFLDRHHITYYRHTTYDMFTNYNFDQVSKEYVVNIHCVK